MEPIHEQIKRRELQKLDEEVSKLKRENRPWFRRPQVLLELFTAFAAVLGVFGQPFLSCRQLTLAHIENERAQLALERAEKYREKALEDAAAAAREKTELENQINGLQARESALQEEIRLLQESIMDHSQNMLSLAHEFRQTFQFDRAAPLYEQVFKTRKRVFGDDPSTGASLTSLAILLRLEGKYAESEHLFRQALTVYEKNYGPAHVETATAHRGLQGEYVPV